MDTRREPRMAVCNVLVIGTGAAGLRAAIAAHEAGSQVVIIGKRLRNDAHTVLAAGGINAALGSVDPEDSWQQHVADTLDEGHLLGDARFVELLAREAPRAVLELAEWGCPFARTADGSLDQRFFGAHTWRRTCYAGDYTGRVILSTLVARVESLGITVHDGQYVSRLLVQDGVCAGAMAFGLADGQRTVYLADAVVLAAGGHTRLWRRSSSRRDENTGDGMALALTAGGSLRDMELVQFHPTGMVWPEEVAGTLVTEAVRGEGGHLLNAGGERFMTRYDPGRMELSARDLVAMANYSEIAAGRAGPHGGVLLDITHLPKDVILEKLPRMYRQFMEWQLLDISREPMEVAPTAHYSMGGVVVDPDSQATEVEGLFAAGEVTGGLHGANRLGGNSLSETIVFGRRAGEYATRRSLGMDAQLRPRRAIAAAQDELDAAMQHGPELARPLQRALRNAMSEGCGVVRDETRLKETLERIKQLTEASAKVDVRPSSEGYLDLAVALDLRGSLLAAEATVRGAIQRRESRGAHQRSDYPAMDPSLALSLRSRLREGGVASGTGRGGRLETTTSALPPMPPSLSELMESKRELSAAGRLLE